jgi:hypothetical protein
MKIAYVAGPFRALSYWEQELNCRQAEAIALELWRMGFAVICPHANTRFFDGAAPDSTFLAGDLEFVRLSDCVVLTPDWAMSEGARGEREEATKLGIPTFRWPEDLGRIRSFAPPLLASRGRRSAVSTIVHGG